LLRYHLLSPLSQSFTASLQPANLRPFFLFASTPFRRRALWLLSGFDSSVTFLISFFCSLPHYLHVQTFIADRPPHLIPRFLSMRLQSAPTFQSCSRLSSRFSCLFLILLYSCIVPSRIYRRLIESFLLVSSFLSPRSPTGLCGTGIHLLFVFFFRHLLFVLVDLPARLQQLIWSFPLSVRGIGFIRLGAYHSLSIPSCFKKLCFSPLTPRFFFNMHYSPMIFAISFFMTPPL